MNHYHEVMKNFRMADSTLRRAIEKYVARTGVYRSQHQMLMNLGKHPDCSQMELAQRLEITPAAVATTIKKLEKGGYVTRLVSEQDNRVNKLAVTEKGERIIARWNRKRCRISLRRKSCSLMILCKEFVRIWRKFYETVF